MRSTAVAAEDKMAKSQDSEATSLFLSQKSNASKMAIALDESKTTPKSSYDAVVETLATTSDTSLPKSPSKYVRFPQSPLQRERCLCVIRLMAEAMRKIMEDS